MEETVGQILLGDGEAEDEDWSVGTVENGGHPERLCRKEKQHGGVGVNNQPGNL